MDNAFMFDKKYTPIVSNLTNKEWKYSLHAHKTRNGIHYDLMLSPPNESLAYSWSTKTVPFRGGPTKARRTKDHLRSDMDFSGEFVSRTGFQRKKLLSKGNANIPSIDDKGIRFDIGKSKYLLRHDNKKNYYIEVLDA